jgi:hypothetical protein
MGLGIKSRDDAEVLSGDKDFSNSLSVWIATSAFGLFAMTVKNQQNQSANE